MLMMTEEWKQIHDYRYYKHRCADIARAILRRNNTMRLRIFRRRVRPWIGKHFIFDNPLYAYMVFFEYFK